MSTLTLNLFAILILLPCFCFVSHVRSVLDSRDFRITIINIVDNIDGVCHLATTYDRFLPNYIYVTVQVGPSSHHEGGHHHCIKKARIDWSKHCART